MKVLALITFMILGFAVLTQLANQIYSVEYPLTDKIIMLEKIKVNKEDYNPSLHYVIYANYGNGSVIEKIVTDSFEKANMYQLPPFKMETYGIGWFLLALILYLSIFGTALCNC
jgi:hypothetical protein